MQWWWVRVWTAAMERWRVVSTMALNEIERVCETNKRRCRVGQVVQKVRQRVRGWGGGEKNKTFGTRDSQVIPHLTTSLARRDLSLQFGMGYRVCQRGMAERTSSLRSPLFILPLNQPLPYISQSFPMVFHPPKHITFNGVFQFTEE